METKSLNVKCSRFVIANLNLSSHEFPKKNLPETKRLEKQVGVPKILSLCITKWELSTPQNIQLEVSHVEHVSHYNL